jgi:hypothetical protein
MEQTFCWSILYDIVLHINNLDTSIHRCF